MTIVTRIVQGEPGIGVTDRGVGICTGDVELRKGGGGGEVERRKGGGKAEEIEVERMGDEE